jgi:hypothetical protein
MLVSCLLRCLLKKARLESGLQMLEAERRKMEAEVMEKRRKYQEEAQLGSRHGEIRWRPVEKGHL